MTRYTPLWLQSGSYAASVDRRLVGALWPSAHSDGCAVSTAGTDMTVNVAPGSVSVPTANGTGSVLCSSDAQETVILPAAPASGLDRWDQIVCRPRGTDLDGGANNDFVFDYVSGAAAATGTATVPATPPGTVALANVLVPGGSAAVIAANIHDVRPPSLAIPAAVPWSAPRGYVAQIKGPPADVTGAGAITGLTLTFSAVARRRYRCWGNIRGSTSAAGAASVRFNGGWGDTPYPMVVERINAANEALSGMGSIICDPGGTSQTASVWFSIIGGGTVKALANSGIIIAEDIGGY